MFVSYSTSFLLILIIIVKLPFIEAGVFFNNLSLWQSTKYSFEQTQNNVLKATLLFAAITLFLYLALIKASYTLAPLSLTYKSIGFFFGLLTANFEILGKLIIVSLFLSIPVHKSDNVKSVA